MSSKSPEIRFNGYTDDWEQRKLGDLMSFSNGINAPKENYGSGTKMISVMDILTTELVSYNNIQNSVSVTEQVEEKNKVEQGDIVFVRSSEVVEEVGWAKAYLDDKYALYSGFTIRGKKEVAFNSFFVEHSLNNTGRRQIERKAGGSTRFNVSQGILNTLLVKLPSYEEQNQIGTLFKKLDDTIALHQRELDNLLKSKKGFLQKMFPKQGGKVPEVRFSKFAKDWKQHDLKDIYKKSNEKNKNLKYGKEYIISVAKMQYKENDSVSSEDYMKTYNVMKKNDIAFEGNKSKKYKYGRFVLNDIGDGIVSHVFIVMRPKMEMSASFLKEYINNESVMQQILLFSTTSTLMMTTLNTKEFLEQKLRLPSLEEQLEIGSFFEELDSSIFLKQKQLNNLKQTKKAFLQKMFV